MTEHAKIFPAAKKFVERFGKDALTEARKRAIELENAGRADGSATWVLIYQEVKVLMMDDARRHEALAAGTRVKRETQNHDTCR